MITATLPRPRTAEPDTDTAEAESVTAWALVRATQAGDMTAFGALYGRYRDMVQRYVLFRLGDRQLAEDFTAETFERALRRIGSVTYQGRDPGAWLVTIARNLVLDHVKRSRTRRETAASELLTAEHGPTSGHCLLWGARTARVDDEAGEAETLTMLADYVSRLNPQQREVIHLRFTDGCSVAETARRMGSTQSACKATQHRACLRLAQLMAADGYVSLGEFAGTLVAA